MSFLDDFRQAMIRVAEKEVSHNDATKGYYYVTVAQQRVISLAGIKPATRDEDPIEIYAPETDEILWTTYYRTYLEAENTKHEIRMGRGLVNWYSEGDVILFGTNGRRVYVCKVAEGERTKEEEDEDKEKFAKCLDKQSLIDMVKKVKRRAPQRRVTTTVFERDPYIREYARRRSDSRCEMPGCSYRGFKKTDGTRYIEVHHVQSLADQGFDVVENVAAVCANCHRKAHHIKQPERDRMREQLIEAVRLANERYRSTNEE